MIGARALAMATVLASVAGCGPAAPPGQGYEPDDFVHHGLVASSGAGGVWLHVDKRIPASDRALCELSVNASYGHFYGWAQAFGQRALVHETHIYVVDEAWVLDPILGYSGDRLGYLLDGEDAGAARTEIVVVPGGKFEIPGLTAQLHAASCWPRDPWRDDPANDWDLVLGYTIPAGQTTGLLVGPAGTVQVQTTQAQWVPGLQERIVADIRSRR